MPAVDEEVLTLSVAVRVVPSRLAWSSSKHTGRSQLRNEQDTKLKP